MISPSFSARSSARSARLSSADRPSGDVLIVSHNYSEPSQRHQIEEFARYVDVRVIAPSDAEVLVFGRCRLVIGGSEDWFRPVRSVPLFGAQHVFASLGLGLRRDPPDLVHIDYDPWTIVFWQVRILVWMFCPGTPVVISSKKNTYRRYPGMAATVKRGLARLGLRSAAHVFCASRMNRDMLRHELGLTGVPSCVTVPVGVDTDLFRPGPGRPADGRLVVGYCGRLVRHKGVLDLVEAVAALAAAGQDVELRLLGAGPLDGRLRELAARHPWLRLLPAVPVREVAAFLPGLDVFVLPTHSLLDHEEHDAQALLQAMACGLPVVGTRSGIVPEILEHTAAGLLVDAGDPAGLTAALTTLAADDGLRRRCGAAGRARAAARFSMRVTARRHAQVYQQVVRRSRRRTADGPAVGR